jgi:hypothetical protein
VTYKPGTILFIENFIFKDGVEKDTGKYIIVLGNFKKKSVIISITTSQDHVPYRLKTRQCIHEKNMNIHVYYFPVGREICSNGYGFPKSTYIYLNGGHIQDYDLNRLEKEIQNGKVNEKGVLSKENLIELLYCIIKSPQVAKKFITIIEKMLKYLIE